MRKNTMYTRNQRRPLGIITPYTINNLHLRNPWIIAGWSALFPGFGHLSLGYYIKGFILVMWEILVNLNSHINDSIMYSFQGKFEQARSVLDKRWVFIYMPVFAYAIWASYRSTVDLNKFSLLAASENSHVHAFSISTLEINFLDKRSPWVSALFSSLMPGTGHLYTHRIPMGFFVFLWWIALTYYSHILEAIYFTAIGSFSQATGIIDTGWFLFMPSVYGFTIYDAYVNTVEYNKLFDTEQSQFLKRYYQNTGFDMPV